MSFDSVADGLYGLAPGDFVAERNAAQKQARGDGDRELASQIQALAKPTVVGWLANQLVRRHPEEIGPLLELGAGLRDATENLSGEKLQELTRLQHQVIAGLVKQARQLAKEAGQRVSEDAVRGLEDTLRAALADEELGAQLAAGRLTGGLEHVGFAGGLSASATPKPAPKPAPKKSTPAPKRTDELAARRKAKLAEAEQALTDARERSHEANRAAKQALGQLDKASAKAESIGEKVKKLEDELERVTQDRDAAVQAESDARAAAEKADREAARRRQALHDAQAKRDELTQ